MGSNRCTEIRFGFVYRCFSHGGQHFAFPPVKVMAAMQPLDRNHRRFGEIGGRRVRMAHVKGRSNWGMFAKLVDVESDCNIQHSGCEPTQNLGNFNRKQRFGPQIALVSIRKVFVCSSFVPLLGCKQCRQHSCCQLTTVAFNLVTGFDSWKKFGRGGA